MALATGQRKQNRHFALFTSAVALLVALALLQLSYIQQIDNRAYDRIFNGLHWWRGFVPATPQIGFLAIDDKTVDPDYSPYSSQWDKDGWLTRSLWNKHLEQMGQIFQPKVIAYDILFRPMASSAWVTDDKNVQIIRNIESEGNKEFQSHLIDFDDARSAGQPAPKVVFAYEFPDNADASDRLLNKEKEQQISWFGRLDHLSLPEGSVGSGSRAVVNHAVRLPMEEILSSPSYYLGAINIRPDPDGVYRHVPLLYAYQSPGSSRIGYAPGLALESFLLWLDIDPQDLKPPGHGLPSIEAKPGESLTIRTATHGDWTMPIDDQLRMALVPRFRFKSPAVAKKAGVKSTATTPLPPHSASPPSPAQAKGRNGSDMGELYSPSFINLLTLGFLKEKAGAGVPMDQATQNELGQADDEAAKVHGRILVVGEAYTGADLGDLPLEQLAPRALVHLHALNNFLQRDHVRELPYSMKALDCFLLLAAMGWFFGWGPPQLAGTGAFTLVLVYPVVVAALVISQNLELPLVVPFTMSVIYFALNSYYAYRQTSRGREEMRRLFSTVTSPRILNLLEENPDAFHVHRKTMVTALFSDVQGFTALSENLDPGYLALLINRYLSPMTEIILREDGYLDKYSGDGIMAIWGVPLPDEEHAYKACVSAWKQVEAAEALDEVLPDGTKPHFHIRIGINTGMVSAGNMGSAQKMQYTVMGDEVNLAARLEPASKDYGTQIIIGPKTYDAVQGRLWTRKLDKIVVKGKVEAVTIYELLGLEVRNEPWVTAYEQGIAHLWGREWDEAEALFLAAIRLRGKDSPSELQLSRVREYREDPPPKGWQGEFARLSKD